MQRMRGLLHWKAEVDLIGARSEIAELAKYSTVIGARAEIVVDRMTIQTIDDPGFLETSIRDLVVLSALVNDQSPRDVLDGLARAIGAMHMPMDKKPSDVRGLGEGHVEGQ